MSLDIKRRVSALAGGLLATAAGAGLLLTILGVAISPRELQRDLAPFAPWLVALSVGLMLGGLFVPVLQVVTISRGVVDAVRRRHRPEADYTLTMDDIATDTLRADVARIAMRPRRQGAAQPASDHEMWRRHTARVIGWVTADARPALDGNGMEHPGSRIVLEGEGLPSLFQQHFRDNVAARCEEWNRLLVQHLNAWRTADIKSAAVNQRLGLAPHPIGFPVRWLMVECAAGRDHVVATAKLQVAGGMLCEVSYGLATQIRAGSLQGGDEELLSELRRLQEAICEWPESHSLEVTWRALEGQRAILTKDFDWIETLERLPGHCDRCPDVIPVRN